MRERLQNSTTHPIVFLMIDSTDHITGKTGLTVTVTISKDGGSFAAPSGAVTEIGSGWYSLAGNATDRNTLGSFLIHATATGADPCDMQYTIVGYDPFDGVRMGLTALPNVASGGDGSIMVQGATQTPTLKSLTISNSAGDALTLTSTGVNGNGLNASGNGTGAGIKGTGGATGNGMSLVGGATSGDALLTSTTSGHGATFAGTGAAKHGINATGAPAVVGSAAGSGIVATGGAASTAAGGTSAAGLVVTGGAGAATNNGAAAGATFSGGGTNTVATVASGLVVTGTSNGHGINCVSAGTGNTINGYAGVDWARILNPTSVVGLTNTTIGTVTLVSQVTNLTFDSNNNANVNVVDVAGSAWTAVSIGTTVWTDLTSSSDFSTAGSIGALLKQAIPNAAPGASGGLPTTDASNRVKALDSTGAAFTYVTPPTTAAIATGVWQDTTAGDFTVASSIGALLKQAIPNAAPGASGGLPTTDASNRVKALDSTGAAFTYVTPPTTAAIATGVWQDTTAGDFTVANSIGKSLYTSGAVPGASSGLAIVGSNMGTVTSVTGSVGSVTATVSANVTQWSGSGVPAPNVAGVPLVDLKYTLGTLSTGVAGYVGVDWSHINAPTTVVSLSGTTISAVSGAVGSVTAGVTVTTNNDKAGYSLTVTPPTAAQIATAVLTDTTAGDLGTAGSLGYMIGHAPGWYTTTVTVGTNNDKTGYALSASGLDQIAVTDPGGVAGMTTLPKMMVALWRRFFKKSTLDATGLTLKTFADDGATVNTTQAITTSGNTQTQGPAT